MANPLEVELVWKKKEYKEVMTALTKMSVAAAEATQAIRELHAEIDAEKSGTAGCGRYCCSLRG